MSEKLLEKLKITVKQEGNTRQPAVPSEQKARQPGCEVLCWDSRTLRERCQLFNCLGTKIKGGEVGGRDNRKPGVAAVSQLMTYKAHRMLVAVCSFLPLQPRQEQTETLVQSHYMENCTQGEGRPGYQCLYGSHH